MAEEVDDGYPVYYSERLWQLLPAVYRSADSDDVEATGPLQEIVNRIGGQIAVVRRSIDQLWADQSIETCEDWVIPYIGDLLGTNLVNGLEAAGKRRDVAKTIHYRRRKGTLEVLEELARDVTGWSAHVVEGFRLLARTRHGLDPGLGPAAYPHTGPALAPGLQQAKGLLGAMGKPPIAGTIGLLQTEGLLGTVSRTPAGGFLDLRSPHGAELVDSPFDESFHHADFRAGRGAVGHFGIPKLLVHLWRLRSFTVTATPVQVAGCDGLAYAFDPTGRKLALFLPAPQQPDSFASEDFASLWTATLEWQVPGALTSSLAKTMAAQELPAAYKVEGPASVTVYPEHGQLSIPPPPAGAAAPEVSSVLYSYGFSATIGAGPYDRSLLGEPPEQVEPVLTVSAGSALKGALESPSTTKTVVIENSLTYAEIADVGSSEKPIVSFLCQAKPEQRPVIRVTPQGGQWVFTGAPGAQLVLDGLFICGCDLVLRGPFASVRLTACTLDPGTIAAGGAPAPGSPTLASAVDGAPLVPTRIFIEAGAAAGAIEQLTIDHCILGPIRTRYGGAIETLSISDSIVQAIPTSSASSYTAADVYDPVLLAKGLLADNPLSKALLGELPAGTEAALKLAQAAPSEQPLDPSILAGLNALLARSTPLYDPGSYPNVTLSPSTLALFAERAALDPAGLALLNRQLLDGAFPIALGLSALAVADAAVELERVSVLGSLALQRLSAQGSILTGLAAVDDVQEGCLRFSAIAAGSRVARQYRSVRTAAGVALFTSEAFGEPAYCQLLDSADNAILEADADASITTGAEEGSQMGAFAGELYPIKEQALLRKYAEYMPLGLTPVLIHVT